MVKCLPAMPETQVLSVGRENPLEKEMATHSSILAWEIPWKGSLVGYSPWSHKELDSLSDFTLFLLVCFLITFTNIYTNYIY